VPDEAQDDAETDELREMVDGHAAAFVQRMNDGIQALLGQHAAAVAEFAVHMHNRVRRAEAVADALAETMEGGFYDYQVAPNRITFGDAERLLKALAVYRHNRKEQHDGTN
jgi:hypothetical protein